MNGNQGECAVHIDPVLMAGEYVNAFRVFQDSEREWFLDFLVISHAVRQGRVVSRLRVPVELLQPLQQGISGVLEHLGVVSPQEKIMGLLRPVEGLN